MLSCYFLSAEEQSFYAKGPKADAYKSLKWTKLIDGFNGCEGAQWLESEDGVQLLFAAHHDLLVFSWAPQKGLSLFRSGSPEATSFRPDNQGGLYVVEQGNRRLAKWNVKGETMSVLATHYEGKKLNRPNDARVDGQGRVWFTDPDFLFKKRPHEVKEQDGQYVYVYDPKTNKINAPIKELFLPNGLEIDVENNMLYVGDSRLAKIFRYPIQADGSLGKQELFYSCKFRRLDGLAFDKKGNLWYAGKEGIVALDRNAKQIVTLETPNFPTSMDFHKDGWVCVTLRDSAYITKL